MTDPEALPEWPKDSDGPYTYETQQMAFWESRCRLAVFALEHYKDATTLAEQMVMDMREGSHDLSTVANEALKAIGPLPDQEQDSALTCPVCGKRSCGCGPGDIR